MKAWKDGTFCSSPLSDEEDEFELRGGRGGRDLGSTDEDEDGPALIIGGRFSLSSELAVAIFHPAVG